MQDVCACVCDCVEATGVARLWVCVVGWR
jgi:hypothetical protein